MTKTLLEILLRKNEHLSQHIKIYNLFIFSFKRINNSISKLLYYFTHTTCSLSDAFCNLASEGSYSMLRMKTQSTRLTLYIAYFNNC